MALLRTNLWLATGLQESVKTLNQEILGDYISQTDPKPSNREHSFHQTEAVLVRPGPSLYTQTSCTSWLLIFPYVYPTVCHPSLSLQLWPHRELPMISKQRGETLRLFTEFSAQDTGSGQKYTIVSLYYIHYIYMSLYHVCLKTVKKGNPCRK